jgi:protein-L-isoaspartate(D-aspartate) O-methyltransferase
LDLHETKALVDRRARFAQSVARRGGCEHTAIHAAFERVPRHVFVGPGPWQFSEHGGPSASADPALVYRDLALGLVPESGITTGQPSLHARCLAACEPLPGERVVHIGAGTGYYTALLAELVGAAGAVLAFEIDARLAARAAVNLAPWSSVQVVAGSWTRQPFGATDLIYVSAGVEALPLAWLRALRPGARLLFPLVPEGREGGMLLVRHIGSAEHFAARFLCRARFVPCVGARDPDGGERLAAAFARGGWEAVRSLHLGVDVDGTAWCSGRGWRLSATPSGPSP